MSNSYMQGEYYLPPRSQCLLCDCGGSTFLVGDQIREWPTSPDSHCLCEHPYLAHVVDLQDDPRDPNNARRRGPNMSCNCGGFFSTSHPWEPKTSCHFCLKLWLFHQGTLRNASATTSGPPPQQTTRPVPPSQASSSSGAPSLFAGNPFVRTKPTADILNTATQSKNVSHPSSSKSPSFDFSRPTSSLASPVDAYIQKPRPRAITHFQENGPNLGTVNQQRGESIDRMNTTIASQSPSKRKSSQGTARTGGASRFSSSSNPIIVIDSPPASASTFKYMICVFPFTSNLITTIDVPAQENNIWFTIDSLIRALLASHGIVLRYEAGHSSLYNFEHSPWEGVGPRSTTHTHNRAFSALGLLERDFTHKKLHTYTQRVRHPTDEDTRLFFAAPRWEHLQAPVSIDRFGPSHLCKRWAWRVFIDTKLMNFDRIDTIECVDAGCPDGLPEDSNETQSHSIFGSHPRIKRERQFSDDDQINGTSFKRQRRHSESVISVGSDDVFPETLSSPHRPKLFTAKESPIEFDSDSDSDSDTDMGDAAAPSIATPLLRRLIEAAGAVERLPFSGVLQWQTAAVVSIGPEDALLPLDISGPNVKAVATTLLELIAHFHDDSLQLDTFSSTTKEGDKPVILHSPVPPTGFLHFGRKYNIYSDPADHDAGANGQGPERSTYVAGLNARLADGSRWGWSSGSYSRPQFHPIPDMPKTARIQAYKVDGTWAALFLISLGIGPDPICPFLILAATQQNRDWIANLTLAYIHALDPVAAADLAPWWDITAAKVFKFPEDAGHPGLALAAVHLNIPLTEFCVPRSAEEHKALRIRFLCHYFFGTYDPYVHPEFKTGFVAGFDLRLKGQHTLLSHFPSIEQTKAFLATVYNRRVQSVDQVIQILEFTTADDPDTVRDLYYEQFQLRFLRWIRGVGYPRSLRGEFIGKETYKANRKNPLIRAQSFVLAMTGMPLISPDPSFRLKMQLSAAPNAPFRDTGIQLHFHDCSDALDIPFNEWLGNVLLQPVVFQDLATVTDFDHWMSSECSLAGADYNDI
ncbi:hypothetical protein DFH06DRAFT_1128526 [Mycena polygramma]|nr:hypothetical protein DFH06DRAFT_1128526 [Mycena polygramma]